MFLSRDSIVGLRSDGALFIEPFQAASLRPASYVLHLSGWTRKWKPSKQPIVISDPVAEDLRMEDRHHGDAVRVEPGEFILARSIERVGLSSDLAGVLSPLSHIARFGLSATCGADWVGPGFGARIPTPITFELLNSGPSPLVLKRGVGLCHLRIARVTELNLANASATGVENLSSPYEGEDGLGVPHLEAEPLLIWTETSFGQ